ncbi:DNA-formamidopyrimidine glycosylase [Dehalogenimonas alkenigignens]|uniref:Formamidopyrimidine-DNA glycosylase n=1 Tax=Dehalogenimonas alkenigignens TaxID=1217799 RepID=A0A0W0GH68_9CHLR|nr:DNA-formamidopyrimidine glycosylase [Dehalogenimonas alkenigignens]KTB47895.1 DNA-(apurinic or apyrimidinic site) lyase [Dehalogenimonas alkenigignens]PVV83912.1 DNA-formamidopyrimidine glycosylase [Dehalogenimonas alkenigignens]
MPELPEVETVTNEIRPYVLGRCIEDVKVTWPGTVKGNSAEEFISGLKGQTVVDVRRRGKFIVWELSNGKRLLTHLKMTGALIAQEAGIEPPPYNRVEITLEDGMKIYFRDPRKFGRMRVVEGDAALDELGPEPLEPEFTAEVLESILKKRKGLIKPTLLDQTLIAGIGNMYADEALYEAKIHPLRAADSLSPAEYRTLHTAIQHILATAIKAKGASIANYVRPGGELGHAHFAFKVAHRRGENCSRCGEALERIVVRGRGTYFCPKCQVLNVDSEAENTKSETNLKSQDSKR